MDWDAWARRAEHALDVSGRGDWPGLFAPGASFADPAGARAKIEEYAEIGATMCNLRFRNRSLAHYLEQLEALTSVLPLGFGG